MSKNTGPSGRGASMWRKTDADERPPARVFPLQRNAPIVPVVVIVLTIYVSVGGTGDWHLA